MATVEGQATSLTWRRLAIKAWTVDLSQNGYGLCSFTILTHLHTVREVRHILDLPWPDRVGDREFGLDVLLQRAAE